MYNGGEVRIAVRLQQGMILQNRRAPGCDIGDRYGSGSHDTVLARRSVAGFRSFERWSNGSGGTVVEKSLMIQSTPGRGTTVEIHIPLQADETLNLLIQQVP
jgi:hypothetical protein